MQKRQSRLKIRRPYTINLPLLADKLESERERQKHAASLAEAEKAADAARQAAEALRAELEAERRAWE
jgi:hypothetical protein